MKAWKAAEKRIAELLGGRRLIRASYQESRPDAVAEKSGFSFIVEVKHRKHLPQFMKNALDQAKQHRQKNEVYIAYFHEKNMHRGIIAIDDTEFIRILEGRLEKAKQQSLFDQKQENLESVNKGCGAPF